MADASPLERPFPDVGVADIASGLGWPADSGTILGAVYAGDQARVRRYAWRLWAGVMAPASPRHEHVPVWETWYDTSEVFGDTSDLAYVDRPLRRKMVRTARKLICTGGG